MASEAAETAVPVRLGILGTSLVGRPDLRGALEAQGLTVVVEDTLAAFLSAVEHHDELDVLLVDLEQADDDDLDVLDALVEHSPVPMVFHDVAGRASSPVWVRRLAEKLYHAAAQRRPAAPAATPVAAVEPEPAAVSPMGVPGGLRVWVLGASFGGPEALKRFLTSFHEVPADLAIIVGQHIGDGFVEVLAAQLNRATRFQVSPAVNGARLAAGHVLVAPVRERLRIDARGYIRLEADSVRRVYMPSIDVIMQEVAERFGANSGGIVFSGMGDDGTAGARAIAAAGGTVWAQESGSCAIDSMPSCARATGQVRLVGTPEELAAALAAHLKAVSD